MLKNGAFTPGAAPSTWLGVMGGGQLGRMFAHAAQAMGFKVAVLEPAADCPASHAADHFLCADYADAAALADMGEQCVAVTTLTVIELVSHLAHLKAVFAGAITERRELGRYVFGMLTG